jgi:hypothetical protein
MKCVLRKMTVHTPHLAIPLRPPFALLPMDQCPAPANGSSAAVARASEPHAPMSGALTALLEA